MPTETIGIFLAWIIVALGLAILIGNWFRYNRRNEENAMRLIIEKLRSSVPPMECRIIGCVEEATFRIVREGDSVENQAIICNIHMREYLAEVMEKIPNG